MLHTDRLNSLRAQWIEERLAPLRETFTAGLPAQAEAIDALMIAAERVARPIEPLRCLKAIVHKLAGVAALLGHANVGHLARRSEAMIAEIEAGGRHSLAELGEVLDALVLEMELQAQQGASMPHPADERDWLKLVARR